MKSIALLICLLPLLIAGCGRKGDLYLPKEMVEAYTREQEAEKLKAQPAGSELPDEMNQTEENT